MVYANPTGEQSKKWIHSGSAAQVSLDAVDDGQCVKVDLRLVADSLKDSERMVVCKGPLKEVCKCPRSKLMPSKYLDGDEAGGDRDGAGERQKVVWCCWI